MKKFIVPIMLIVVMMLVIPSASADKPVNNQPYCPSVATIDTMTQGCQLPGNKNILNSVAVSYLKSECNLIAFLMNQQRADFQTRLDAKDQTIFAQQNTIQKQSEKIARLQERIRQLKHRLHHHR